jgi:hypothetical protein
MLGLGETLGRPWPPLAIRHTPYAMTFECFLLRRLFVSPIRGVWHGVCKGTVRQLQAAPIAVGHPFSELRVGRPQGVEWSGITGPSDTLKRPWIPHEIRPRQMLSVSRIREFE